MTHLCALMSATSDKFHWYRRSCTGRYITDIFHPTGAISYARQSRTLWRHRQTLHRLLPVTRCRRSDVITATCHTPRLYTLLPLPAITADVYRDVDGRGDSGAIGSVRSPPGTRRASHAVRLRHASQRQNEERHCNIVNNRYSLMQIVSDLLTFKYHQERQHLHGRFAS